MKRGGLLLAGICVAATIAAAPAGAATFTVTRTADTAPNGCNQGGCTLREAVIAANNRPGADAVQLKPRKTYTLSIAGTGEDESATGDLDVTSPVSIDDPGTARAVIDGGGIDGVLDATARMHLLGVVVRGGTAFGIRTTGAVELNGSRISGNDGYGLQSLTPGGPIRLGSSRITGNAYQGIQASGGHPIGLFGSAVVGNDNQGIQQYGPGGVTLVRSRVTGNAHQGIQEYDGGSVSLRRATVSGNGNQGVQEYDGGAVVLKRGNVSSNDSQGIQTYDGGGLRINGGKVSGNGSQGIQAYDEGDVRILKAEVVGNDSQGVVSYGPHATLMRRSLIGDSAGTNLDVGSTDGLVLDRVASVGGTRGIYVSGGVVGVIDHSTIARNEGDDGGAGVYIAPMAELTVRSTTIERNTTKGVSGGGVLVAAGGTLRMTNSTLFGNRAFFSGGAIRAEGPGAQATLNAVTIARNVANYTQASINSGGGGINSSGGATFDVSNSLIALNKAPGGVAPDCYANLGSGGNNVLTNTDLCSGMVSSDDDVGNPRIGALRGNGGPTATIALKRGSPAIGHAGNDAPSRDQRGRKRDKNPDAGAFER